MLSSHSIVPSSRTVRLCSPWEGRWIRHWRTTWLMVYSCAPHSQTAEEAILHLYKHERKRPIPVRKRLSRTQVLLWNVTPEVWCRGWKCWVLWFSVLWGCPPTPHSIGDPPNAPHVCCCQMSWWVAVRRVSRVSRYEAPCICSRWQVSAGWSRCPGSMTRPARDSVAPMRRSSADWMPARIGRLSANVGRSHPVTIRKASLMAGSIKRVRHQTGAQYPADECTRARVAIRRVVAPAPQPEPASQERDAWCQLLAKWLEVSAISERPVQRYSEVFGLEAEGQDFVDEVDFQLTFGFLDVKMEGCRHRFSRAELYLPCLEVFTYGCHVLAQYPFHRLPISINMHDY